MYERPYRERKGKLGNIPAATSEGAKTMHYGQLLSITTLRLFTLTPGRGCSSSLTMTAALSGGGGTVLLLRFGFPLRPISDWLVCSEVSLGVFFRD